MPELACKHLAERTWNMRKPIQTSQIVAIGLTVPLNCPIKDIMDVALGRGSAHG